ncbi:unnamed protein product [Allacma fusca]|uniref:Uncharacterized protein n=1 Tax=Allacma fusca TaxID=39272 RepID=A0A8J2NY28_9HEXA|nr:unnamed protein product [Allacma fusca]
MLYCLYDLEPEIWLEYNERKMIVKQSKFLQRILLWVQGCPTVSPHPNIVSFLVTILGHIRGVVARVNSLTVSGNSTECDGRRLTKSFGIYIIGLSRE